ncbi:glycosyltransferase [Caulobacter sp. SSI4214]|uniref:glycosyltransferase n=1 Tax=Caulobacter sp. SSI4214 TaxID=2575739 RepID=UPI00143BEF16|nr:glycosyltransferase [Caulobacter sp. SSI4214]
MPERSVVGIEVLSRSSEYDWVSEAGQSFQKVTLSSTTDSRAWSPWKIVATILKQRPQAVFFCHYQRPEILIAAMIVRARGIETFTMNDSKFDDYPRDLWRELAKSVFFLPYQGALAGSKRSADYLRFLGVRADRIVIGYDAVSTDRIRSLAGAPPAPGGASFADRHFTVIARLLPKKNIATVLRALALLADAGTARRLVVCGSGPMEIELKQLAKDLGLSNLVEFRGFVQTAEVCQTLAQTLALVLSSTEEQFGQVIPEALSMGVPVLASDNCGARDHLVRTGVNGFIFEPHNVEGLAYLMSLMGSNEPAWRTMADAAFQMSEQGDVAHFVEGVRELLRTRTPTERPMGDTVAQETPEPPSRVELANTTPDMKKALRIGKQD